jgi:hypothetical protein
MPLKNEEFPYFLYREQINYRNSFCVYYNKLCKYINNYQNVVDVRKFSLVEIY